MHTLFDAGSNTLGIKVGSKLTKQDYEEVIPAIEQKLQEFGELNILIQLEEFEGMEIGALWEDLKFDVKHRNDFNRLAIVGQREWMKWMTKLSKPFFDAEVKFFEPDQVQEAWQWLGVKEKISPQ